MATDPRTHLPGQHDQGDHASREGNGDTGGGDAAGFDVLDMPDPVTARTVSLSGGMLEIGNDGHRTHLGYRYSGDTGDGVNTSGGLAPQAAFDLGALIEEHRRTGNPDDGDDGDDATRRYEVHTFDNPTGTATGFAYLYVHDGGRTMEIEGLDNEGRIGFTAAEAKGLAAALVRDAHAGRSETEFGRLDISFTDNNRFRFDSTPPGADTPATVEFTSKDWAGVSHGVNLVYEGFDEFGETDAPDVDFTTRHVDTSLGKIRVERFGEPREFDRIRISPVDGDWVIDLPGDTAQGAGSGDAFGTLSGLESLAGDYLGAFDRDKRATVTASRQGRVFAAFNATDGPKTKGMVALIPSDADAERLAVEGGVPKGELHLTLLFLGDADDWDTDAQERLLNAARSFDRHGPVVGDAFAPSLFNPGSDDACVVLLTGGQPVDDIHTAVLDAVPDDLPVPPQRKPWMPHITLRYTDDLDAVGEVADRCGPITFDRIRVAVAGAVTDIPLTDTAPSNVDGAKPMEARAVNPFLRQPAAYQRTPVRAEAPTPKQGKDGVVTLRLYDPLDSWGEYWGVSAKEFVTVLDALPDDTTEIHLLINSPGGEAWEGLAILNALRAHPAKVVAVVEGIAASAASFIAAGVDECHMMRNSEMFVHRAWGFAIGNTEVMEKMAADLAHEDRNLASIYAAKAGGSEDDWLAAMSGDTWYSADEAVAAGLADKVIEPAKGEKDSGGAAAAKNRFDLSLFQARTRDRGGPTNTVDLTPAPAGAHKSPAAEPEPNTDPTEDIVSDLSDIARGLGLPENADKEAILAAIGTRPQPDEPNPTDPDTTDGDPEPTSPAPQAKATLPEGVVAIEKSVLDDLRAKAEAGAQAAQRQYRDDRDRVIQDAVTDGKISPARTEHWARAWDADPDGTRELLASLEAGLVVPTQSVGYTGTAEPSNSVDAEYAEICASIDPPAMSKGA